MTQKHHIELVQTTSGYTRYTCYVCDQAGDFMVKAYNGDPLTFDVQDTQDPENAFEEIVAHLEPDSNDEDTARHLAMARTLVKESINVMPGVTLLAATMPNVGLSAHDERLEDHN